MKISILPRSRWPEVEKLSPFTFRLVSMLHTVRPEDAKLVVAEKDGKIIGCLSSLKLVHLEGTWVAEGERGGLVAYRMLCELQREADRATDPWTLASAPDGDAGMVDYLNRLGAIRLPVSFYFLPPQGRRLRTEG